MADERMLSEDEVALVFRRAAELEAEAPGERTELDVATVERIAVEAGLSPAAVRQAVAELRTGRLPVPAATGRGLVVPSRAVVERGLDLPADAVRRRLDGYLRAQMFRVCRRRGDLVVWEPSRSLAANVMRGIDVVDRMRLRKVDGVEVEVASGASGRGYRTHVRIVLDLANVHRNARAGTITGATFGAAGVVGAAVGFAAGVPEVALVIPVTTGIAAGAHYGSRSTAAKHVKKAVDAIELVLDELDESGRY